MRACVLVLLLASTLHAASLDCTQAKAPLEETICTDRKLIAADATMAKLYRADLAQLTSASIGLLRTDQVQWLAWIQQLCQTKNGAPSETVACLQPLYTDRIKTLRKAVTRRDGLSFLTRTQYLASPDTEQSNVNDPYPGFGTLVATWPIADTTDDDWAAWNHAIELRVLRLAGPADKAVTQWSDDFAQGEDATVTATLKSIEHDRVTTGVALEEMTHGGAHPSESWETLTYLLNNHRALRADDIFHAGAQWQQALAQISWQQMSTGDKKAYIYDQVKGPDARAIQQTVTDPRNWTLEPDGLHISYPEYSVSPRYALMDDAVIPWNLLKPLLSSDFVLP